MTTRSTTRFEAGLQKIVVGLSKPRPEKRYGKLMERIGRLKAQSREASRHYEVTLVADETNKVAACWTMHQTSISQRVQILLYTQRNNHYFVR